MTDTNRELDPNSAEQPDLDVSVIIPARNEERSLPACLASLLIQSETGFALGQRYLVGGTYLVLGIGAAVSHPVRADL